VISSAIPSGADVRGRRPRRQGIVTAASDCHVSWTRVAGAGDVMVQVLAWKVPGSVCAPRGQGIALRELSESGGGGT